MTEQITPQNHESIFPLTTKRYYRVDEVAVYFAISVRTVYRLLDDGDLMGAKIRGCLRVSTEEIIRFEKNLTETED